MSNGRGRGAAPLAGTLTGDGDGALRLRDRRGRLRGKRPRRTACRADPSNRVLVLEAGRPDYIWDVFIHMPAALPFPIGSRFYDWKYESEPEPHMNGRRIYHARGKVLGGSSSINGMIFQRGNPLDYERWGADPGMETWDYAHCLPYFKRMERCLAAAPRRRVPRPRRTAGPGARAGDQARCSARSSRRCSRPATRSPTT